jgi:hypothetical protein
VIVLRITSEPILSKKIIIISKASISISIGYKLKLIYKIPLLILIY